MVYTGTLSKVLLPALRLGYLVAPPSLQPAISGAKWLTDRHVALLYQAVLALFIDEGHFERHLRRMRKVYERRRNALLESFDTHFGERARLSGAESGMHVLVHIEDIDDPEAFIADAAGQGVGIYSARHVPHAGAATGRGVSHGLLERGRGWHPRRHPHTRRGPSRDGPSALRAPVPVTSRFF